MMVLAYRSAILQAAIPGIVEVNNGECSLMIHFDPTRIHYHDLLKEISKIEEDYAAPEKWIIASRLIEIPVWFDDPWSLECYLVHKELHQDKDGSMSNLMFCAELNNMTKEEFIQKLVSAQYLVFSLGFTLGAQGFLPLVRKQDFMTVPKYEASRAWTPARALCAGGINYSIHPYITPGGYQMLGRSAVPVSSLEPSEKVLPAFKDKVVLSNLADRIVLRSVDKDEYEGIRIKVKDGTYEYGIIHQNWEPNKWIENPIKYKGTERAI
jgi:urea carboxylase